MQGVYVWDNKGNKYLDALAGLWCASLGKFKIVFWIVAVCETVGKSLHFLFNPSRISIVMLLATSDRPLQNVVLMTIFFWVDRFQWEAPHSSCWEAVEHFAFLPLLLEQNFTAHPGLSAFLNLPGTFCWIGWSLALLRPLLNWSLSWELILAIFASLILGVDKPSSEV